MSTPPQASFTLVYELVALSPTAHVARDGQGPATELLLHFLREGLAGVELAAGDDDVGPMLGERQNHRPPEAAAPTGDERAPAG